MLLLQMDVLDPQCTCVWQPVGILFVTKDIPHGSGSRKRPLLRRHLENYCFKTWSCLCAVRIYTPGPGSVGKHKDCFLFLLSLLFSFESALLYLHFFSVSGPLPVWSCLLISGLLTLLEGSYTLLYQSNFANSCLFYLTWIPPAKWRKVLPQQSVAFDLLLTALRTG